MSFISESAFFINDSTEEISVRLLSQMSFTCAVWRSSQRQVSRISGDNGLCFLFFGSTPSRYKYLKYNALRPVIFLHCIHLGKSCFCGAVYACHIHCFFFTDYGFSLVACVVKCLANIAVNRLVRVRRIAQNTADAVGYSPYFCYCHGESLALSGSPIEW